MLTLLWIFGDLHFYLLFYITFSAYPFIMLNLRYVTELSVDPHMFLVPL